MVLFASSSIHSVFRQEYCTWTTHTNYKYICHAYQKPNHGTDRTAQNHGARHFLPRMISTYKALPTDVQPRDGYIYQANLSTPPYQACDPISRMQLSFLSTRKAREWERENDYSIVCTARYGCEAASTSSPLYPRQDSLTGSKRQSNSLDETTLKSSG